MQDCTGSMKCDGEKTFSQKTLILQTARWMRWQRRSSTSYVSMWMCKGIP